VRLQRADDLARSQLDLSFSPVESLLQVSSSEAREYLLRLWVRNNGSGGLFKAEVVDFQGIAGAPPPYPNWELGWRQVNEATHRLLREGAPNANGCRQFREPEGAWRLPLLAETSISIQVPVTAGLPDARAAGRWPRSTLLLVALRGRRTIRTGVQDPTQLRGCQSVPDDGGTSCDTGWSS